MPWEKTTFDSLASQIPEDERKALFTRITESVQYSSSPFHEDEAGITGGEYGDIEEAYLKKGFWERLVCILMGFFSRKKPVEVFQDRLLKGLRLKIESAAAGLVDMRDGSLTDGFLSRLGELKDAARFFYAALESSLERDKGEFAGFLGSVYLEEADRRLTRECDPYALGEENHHWDDQTVLRSCLESMDQILAVIAEDWKKIMYRQFRTLFCLKKLAAFPFDHLMASFEPDSAGRKNLSIALASPRLSELADILASLYEPPPEDLMELMFLFPIQRLFKDDRPALESSIRESMKKANTAVAEIRSFMAEVPLVDLVRYARKELSYAPAQLSGGEEWFSQFKAFWRSKIEDRYTTYTRERKRMRLQDEIDGFLGGRSLKEAEDEDAQPTGPDALVLRHGFALSFIKTAFETVFVEDVNRPLKIVLIDGQFFRQDNRLEFTDACNEFFRTPEIIKGFETRLSHKGDLGRLYDDARLDFASTGSKQNRILTAIQTASAEGDRILVDFLRSIRTILAIIVAILRPEPGSRYESLQNLSSIDGRMNTQFKRSMERAKERLERFQGIIAEIAELDSIRLDI